MMRRVLVLLLGGLLSAWVTDAHSQALSVRLDLSAQTVVTPSSEHTLSMEIFQLVGFDALQVIKFSIEYDPGQLEVLQLRPGPAIAGWPVQDLVVSHQPGRVSVVAITGSPVQIVDHVFFELDLRASDDLYDGERPTLRVRGAQPAEPVQLLATLAGDPIKAIARDAELYVDGGVTCLAGDALGDGGFDAGDAIAILRIVTGLLADPDAGLRCGADADADGRIDVGDAVLTLRRAVGLSVPAARADLAPRLWTEVRSDGLVLHFSSATEAYGVQLAFSTHREAVVAVDVGAADLVARNLGGEAGRVAAASARSLADEDGNYSVRVTTAGSGQVGFAEIVLFDAEGRELFREDGEPGASGISAPRAGRPQLGNVPNPFNPRTAVWMDLPSTGRVVLEIFDMRGRRLATLLDEVRAAGRSELDFDGKVDGEPLPSGVYFARLRTPLGEAVHRMTLLK